MEHQVFERAESFIYNNARLIDRHLFAYLFTSGAREPVLAALRAYQNEDGGFGNGLEPDIRAPVSQPQPVEIAFHILDMIDGFDDPMVARACDYLMTITGEAGGVPFSLPTLNPYPHAPWWQAAENPPPSLNPTAALAGLLLKHGVDHPWVARATAFCWRETAASTSAEYHDVMPMLLFLEHAAERERATHELARIQERVLAAGTVALDPAAEGYVHRPLDWATAPDRAARSWFSNDLIASELAQLVAMQQEDGGWLIAWPPISPACELEWRGWLTVGVLRKMRAFGRV